MGGERESRRSVLAVHDDDDDILNIYDLVSVYIFNAKSDLYIEYMIYILKIYVYILNIYDLVGLGWVS